MRKKKTRIKIATDEDLRTQTAMENPSTESAEPELREPESEVDTLRKELADVKDQFLRAKAEQQNIQKRTAQERFDAVRYANAALIKDLLGTIDDFERTLEHGADSDVGSLLEGMRLVHDNLLKVLKDQFVEVIDALDQAFDPNCHEAMLQRPAEGKEPGTVIQVVQRGYRLNDRVLRPAKVIIAAAPQEPGTDDEPFDADTTATQAVEE